QTWSLRPHARRDDRLAAGHFPAAVESVVRHLTYRAGLISLIHVGQHALNVEIIRARTRAGARDYILTALRAYMTNVICRHLTFCSRAKSSHTPHLKRDECRITKRNQRQLNRNQGTEH